MEIITTYFYDVCLNWHGVCIEANSQYYEPIRKLRNCSLVRRTVGDTRGLFTFVDYLGLSGIADPSPGSIARRFTNCSP